MCYFFLKEKKADFFLSFFSCVAFGTKANVFPRLETGLGLALEPGSGRWATIIIFLGGILPPFFFQYFVFFSFSLPTDFQRSWNDAIKYREYLLPGLLRESFVGCSPGLCFLFFFF